MPLAKHWNAGCGLPRRIQRLQPQVAFANVSQGLPFSAGFFHFQLDDALRNRYSLLMPSKQSSPTIVPPVDEDIAAFEEASAKSDADAWHMMLRHIGRMMNDEMREDAQRARWGPD